MTFTPRKKELRHFSYYSASVVTNRNSIRLLKYTVAKRLTSIDDLHIACDRVGIGYKGLELFCSLMNMPQPMASKAYDEIVKTLSVSCKEVAEESMHMTSSEIHQNLHSPSCDSPAFLSTESQSEKVVDTSISIDGSWQKHRYSSLNGLVAALSMDSGKVIDIEVMSRCCKQCLI